MEQAATVEQKQNYIVSNIDPSYYEDFHQFCITEAGQINIEKWSMKYVRQLVTNFTKQMKKLDEQKDSHQKSFAIYQTTTNINAIMGSAKIETDEILSSLQEPKMVKQAPKSPNPPPSKQIKGAEEIKMQKRPQAIALLDQVLQKANKSASNDKKQLQNKEKINKSFFDTSSFWEVPTLQEPKNIKSSQKQQTKVPGNTAPTFNKSPNGDQNRKQAESPKKGLETIKLKINVNELTNKNKAQQVTPERRVQVTPQQQSKSPSVPKSSQSEIYNYSNDFNAFDNFFNTNSIPKSTEDKKNNNSQFKTFSMLAQQQFKKKNNDSNNQNTNRRQTESTIKLKQIKQLKQCSSSSFVQNNSVISNKARSNKQPYRGEKVFKADFVDHVPCIKSPIRPNLSDRNICIEIKTFQIVQRSIFSSNYIMYHMKIQPSGVICKRNYQDFTRLRSTLQKFYPGIQLPYLEKQGWRSGTGEQQAKKQGQMLEFFMADIINNNQLRNSRIIQQFLTLQDHKKIKRKFQQYDKMTKLKSIQQLCLLEGKVQVALTESERIYNQSMGKLVVKIQNNLQKYRKNCESINYYYTQTMNTILTIDDILKQMQNDIDEFNKSVTIKQIENLDKSLKKIRDHYKQNYFRTKFEKRMLEESILPFLTYEKQNMHVSKDIIETTKSLISKYLKKVENEGHSAGSSYLHESNNQYKQGITQDSKNILVFKYQTGFMLAQSSKQSNRILTQLGIKIDLLWKYLSSQYLNQFSNSINIWSTIA